MGSNKDGGGKMSDSVEVIIPPGGGSADPEQQTGDGVAIFGPSFSDKAIRARFVRKVYSILLSQLAITTLIIGVFSFTPAIKGFYCDGTYADQMGLLHCVRPSSNGLVMYLVSFAIFFIAYLTIACCERVRKRSPTNLIVMGIFTLALSVMASSVAIYHDVWWVMMAIGITAALCLGLTLFSFQTRIDFTGIGIYLFAASWILFIFGVLALVFLARGLPIVHTVYSALIALLFSVFLIYDTQMIMGGKKYSISPEEHILAAIMLYVDVVYIFLAILQIGGRR